MLEFKTSLLSPPGGDLGERQAKRSLGGVNVRCTVEYIERTSFPVLNEAETSFNF